MDKKPAALRTTAQFQFRLLVSALAILAISCSGGGGAGNPVAAPAPGPVAGLCPHAFDPATSGGLRAVPAATATTAAPVALSNCTFDSNRNVVIGSGGCGPDVYVDKSFAGANGLGTITIEADGQLVFLHDPGLELDTSGIIVNGKFQVGNASCPVGSDNKSSVAIVNFTDAHAVAGVTKGITVNKGGTLQLYGATGVVPSSPPAGANPQSPSWTYLSAPAGPPSLYRAGMGVASPVGANGATTLQLADRVDWQPGQWIVVAGTDFSPDGGEFVMINAVSNCAGATTGTCTITLDSATPLVNYHFGGPAPDTGSKAMSDGASQNYGVDERAEVGLISRNVKLTATITGSDQHWGGEIVIMAGYNAVEIQGAELEKFGKDQAGSYPIHFHMAGTPSGKTLVDSNSIHHGFNHCITLHSTNNLTISNNVCARIVDHLYYLETGAETGNTFVDNLGIGAMSNLFTIAGSAPALAQAAFWAGDYLTNDPSQPWYNGYNGFNVPFTDNLPPSAATVVGDTSGDTSSGFWITNPGANKFVGNSVAGCQDQGRGFWILPAQAQSGVPTTPLPKGNFASNRAHGCYTGFDTASDLNLTGAASYTPQGACVGGVGVSKGLTDCDLIAEFDDLTATRNRNRGIWVRPAWYELAHAHLATNRDGASLVSSGGSEGSPPGEWGLLRDSIVVGISTNNPNRFGPCPYSGQDGFGLNQGCYGSDGNGFPTPQWNMFGYMFYDGPARVENVRFINFRRDPKPLLTAADVGFLDYFSANNNMLCAPKQFKYEGDAAMGWFQSNENSYPPTQYTKNLNFVNVDLRHEIYTQDVENTCAPPPATGANFRDGDKFTVILDHDASLTDFQVVPNGGGAPVGGVFPISLNNLPFLAGPGTVDECHSTGEQDAVLEGRPTSLISPYNYATLEFSALTAPCNGVPLAGANCLNNNLMVFTKDEIDYPNGEGGAQIQFSDEAIPISGATYTIKCGGSADPSSPGVPGHACVALSGRNGNGIYEPKLVNGLGYTVGASAGMPNFVSLMYTDANLPGGISAANPFHARIGICYQNEGASAPPASAFTVYKGSKSFAGANANFDSLAGFFTLLACNGLDNVMCGPVGTGTPFCYQTLCPAAPFYGPPPTPMPASATQLTEVGSIDQLDDTTTCPNGTCFFYDQTSGLLFINLVQEQPNAGGALSSPLGSCSGKAAGSDPACAAEDFYSTPEQGAELYTIQAASSSYAPNGKPSACTPYGASAPTDYTQAYPANLNQLAYASNGTVVQTQLDGASTPFPHQSATNAPAGFCPTNAPPTPDWPPAPASAIPTIFTIGLPAGVSVALSPSVNPIPVTGQPLYPLTQQTYTLMASAPSGTNGCSGSGKSLCSCSQSFTVTSTGGWSSSGDNCCQMGTGNSKPTIGVAAPPYLCAGP